MTNKEAIKILKFQRGYFCDFKGCQEQQAFTMAIKALEQTRWIPVSERLPEKAFGCLVTVEEDDIYGEPQRVIYPEFVGYDDETWNDAEGLPIPFEVIAWMPLPSSYQGV